MNINKGLDKAYEGKGLKELCSSPLGAIAGVSESDAKVLKSSLNVETIKDFAELDINSINEEGVKAFEKAFGIKNKDEICGLKYLKWAKAIVTLSDIEE